MAVRGNLNIVEDAKIWWDICYSDIAPTIEDKDVCDAALSCLPEGDITPEIWKPWTKAVQEATGAKGKGLFMPLRVRANRSHGRTRSGKSIAFHRQRPHRKTPDR